MKSCVLQNFLEFEPYNFIKYPYWPMVRIYALRSLSLFRRYVNTHIMLIFVSCIVCVIFPFINNGLMINFVIRTGFILLKQHSKGIILVILLFRCEFISNSSTKINILQVICNWRDWGTADYYRITIIHIDSMYAFLYYLGHILQGLRRFSIITKPFDW